MLALAERLRYTALESYVRDKPWDILYGIMRPSIAMGARWILRECVDACFAALGSDARICADEDGLLQQAVVAAVLAHEVRTWSRSQREGSRSYLVGPQYDGFWGLYHGVTSENAELLTGGEARQAKPVPTKVP